MTETGTTKTPTTPGTMITPREAAELIHDAIDSHGHGYHDRYSGEVDMDSGDLATALLKAGWLPPDISRVKPEVVS
jgi:hypothetical protein